MSRGSLLLSWAAFSAVAFLAAGSLGRADDAKPSAPPGYKTVFVNVGGARMPVQVKEQLDPLRNVTNPADPNDPRRLFSSENPMANKSFSSGGSIDWNKTATLKDPYVPQVYDLDKSTSVYRIGSKSLFHNSAFATGRAAGGFSKSFSTSTADVGQNQAALAFAAIGAPEQNRVAPIDVKPFDTYADAMANKTFQGPEEEARHKHLKKNNKGETVIDQLPDRPLTIDEVRDLLNNGTEPDTSKPPPPASKPLNDPDYQPEPLRNPPEGTDVAAPKNAKDDSDDKDDPVPPPGTMAEPPPENSEPLPKP